MNDRTTRLLFALLVAAPIAACDEPSPPRTPVATRSPGLVAFDTIERVLHHPRCQNCHPDGDAPLVGDDGRKHGQNVHRGKDGRGEVGEGCGTCHGPANPPSAYGEHVPPGAAEPWRMPPDDTKLVFAGLRPGELCERIKDPTKNGGRSMTALRMHLDTPLVTWGWSPGFGRAPVPVPREEFVAAWETWAREGAPCPSLEPELR